ncbi:TetR/AcrR family transcriptional regulator [Halobacillus salinus]|uniref:TetR/AcrR family transcriptional regulator n=1 Tax=Halobacillus salinus TaxID=192814 RepID=A0A4Z0GU57_9BACI|nr:TetR/AcrR family transcriptional regulator [Halobacillus salinus]TGB01016.1 TetR/AcrR family transcriptional regulator [Halobacillus salinus]
MSEMKSQPLTKKGLMTRKKLLETAETVFSEKGYFDASIVEITFKSGVAQGTFYNYFPTKKSIYDELVRDLSSTLRHNVKLAIEGEETFEEKQRAGFKAFFTWVMTHRNSYSIIQQSVLVDKDLYRWYYEKLANGFMNALEEAIQNEECKPLDTEAIAYCLMGIGQFIGMRWVFWEEEEVPEYVFEEAMELVFHGLNT